MYLTHVIRGNLHRINRAGNACQVRRGYARVYSTNNGLRAPHVTQEPDYKAALAAV